MNKLRQNENKAVADLAKDIVRKWKVDVGANTTSKAVKDVMSPSGEFQHLHPNTKVLMRWDRFRPSLTITSTWISRTSQTHSHALNLCPRRLNLDRRPLRLRLRLHPRRPTRSSQTS